ncbi:MAG TPA: hypothetical protein VGN46_06005 [Luteibacter sp.]
MERVLEAHAARAARVGIATSLPDLLERLGRRYLGRAHRRRVRLALDVDPTLATDLVGPIRALGAILQRLLELAIDQPHGELITLRVDVVGDEPGRQTVHFTVDFLADAALETLDSARRMTLSLGGALHVEREDALRAIVELRFLVPPVAPHVDVVALRTTLGSDGALHEVIDALGEALAADVGHLEGALARSDALAVRQWLHRVSGALGMAEATGLAAMGGNLEQEMAVCQLSDMELAVRRFAMDATRALAWLREARTHDPLI